MGYFKQVFTLCDVRCRHHTKLGTRPIPTNHHLEDVLIYPVFDSEFKCVTCSYSYSLLCLTRHNAKIHVCQHDVVTSVLYVTILLLPSVTLWYQLYKLQSQSVAFTLKYRIKIGMFRPMMGSAHGPNQPTLRPVNSEVFSLARAEPSVFVTGASGLHGPNRLANSKWEILLDGIVCSCVGSVP